MNAGALAIGAPVPQTLPVWIAAVLAALAVTSCSNEAAPQVSLGGADASACKALMALPEHQGCDLYVEFGPVAQSGPTRQAAARAWLAANPWAVAQERAGPDRLCLTVPFDRDTEAAYEALKSIGSTSAAGSMRLCSDKGHSFTASDPVDHGGDEVRR